MKISRAFSRLSQATCLVLLSAAICGTASAVEIVAHRGASFDAPENTLASFKLGFEQKADGDELDIYLTKDNKIVVMHDRDTQRTGGAKLKMAEATAKELRKLEVGQWGKWKDEGKFSEKIPFLKEVLAVVPKGKKLVIEIKCGPEIVPHLQKALSKSGLAPEQIVIIGFGYDVVKASKAAMPQYRTLWLHSWNKDKKTGKYPEIDELIAKTKAANLDGMDLDFHFPIDKAFVQKFKAANLHLYTWTVDDPEVAKAEVEAGVEAITTNRPGWLREQLGL